MSALHVKLAHPTSYQLKKAAQRYIYALDLDRAIESVTESCHMCASIKKVPWHIEEQSTSDPVPSVGVQFAADVIRRAQQFILVLRERVTSYTVSCFIPSEKQSDLREGLIRLCLQLRPLEGPHAVIRVDPAPGVSRGWSIERFAHQY